MSADLSPKIIARMHSDFPDKFGIPRQSGMIPELISMIVFEPHYRNPDALRGIENYSHLWLIWHFSGISMDNWSPTVRPPRLGGNERMGVFATRSPFRPNPIGLSSVRLLAAKHHPKYGDVLVVSGADLMDGTPIFDIKPYIPYADSHPEAKDDFTSRREQHILSVELPEDLLPLIPAEKLDALRAVLAQDPRPSYQDDPNRVYGMSFAGLNIRFSVEGDTLTVLEIST